MYLRSMAGGGVACNFHYVIDVHTGQIHKGCACSSGGMCVDQLIFWFPDFLRCAAVGHFYLYRCVNACILADFFQVAVDDLVFKMRHLEIIFLENLKQLSLARNCHFCTGILLSYVDVGDVFLLDFWFCFSGV